MATKRRAKPEAPAPEPRLDAWSNIATGLGVEGRDPTLHTRYTARPRELARDEIELLYEHDAIFARVIDTPAEHATRRGITVTGGDAGDADFGRTMGDELERLDAMGAFYDAIRWEALDGGAGILIGAEDGLDPAEPLDLGRMLAVDFLVPFSRHEVTASREIDRDPKSRTFRQPVYYDFLSSTELGSKRVHASRVLRFPGITTTERRRSSRQGWGLPRAQRIYESVRQFGSVFAYGEGIFKSFSEVVLGISGLRAALKVPDAMGAIGSRMAALAYTASVFNAAVIDKDSETYDRRTLSFSGVSEAMLRMMDHFSATVEIPLSILFGQAPSGLSTDDESGKRTFYDSIATKQRRSMAKHLRFLLLCLLTARTGPTKGRVPAKHGFEFLPLEEPNDEQKANTRLTNATAREKDVQNNVISEEEARTELQNDRRVPYTLSDETSPDFDEPEEHPSEPAFIPPQPGITTTPLPPPRSNGT